MDFSLFRRVADLAHDYDDWLVIGGGEPTLHPDIIPMVAYAAFVAPDSVEPQLITNGTCSRKVWNALMRGLSTEKVSVRVSADIWHDTGKIKPWVLQDANMKKLWWGSKSVTHRRYIIAQGRASGKRAESLKKEAEEAGYREVIVNGYDDGCLDVRVTPGGQVWIDAPKPTRIGMFSEETVDRAKEILQRIEEEQA